jgi:hypothetical protein
MDGIDWEDIILRLTAFTKAWTNGREWFRGPGTDTFVAGKKVEDYVFEAIGRYLEFPEKHDPKLGDLAEYLKYQVIRSLVGNDLRKKENTETADIFRYDDDPDEDDGDNVPYSERIMPYTAASFSDDIDYTVIKEYIEGEIGNDKDAENIYTGIYIEGMKRGEIIEEMGMSPGQFDNGMRRLNTILKRAASHFNEKRSKAS